MIKCVYGVVDQQGIHSYERMRRGQAPSVPGILEAIKVCSNCRDLQGGRRIHSYLLQSGGEADLFVANTLIDMYCKCGSMSHAIRIFECMEELSVVSWTALIQGFTQNGQGEVALEIFLDMQEQGFDPNRITYIAALKACASLGSKELRRKKRVYLLKGRSIHSQAITNGIEMDYFLANTVVDMYGKCGDMVEAKKVFDSFRSRSVVSWSTMILGYAENDEAELALEFFERMQEEGCAPNRVTFLAALKACANLASTEEGRQVDGRFVKLRSLEKIRELHARAAKTLKALDTVMLNCLVDAYGKCGAVVDAHKVFDSLARPTVVSWTAIILGYAQGNTEDNRLAMELFARMQGAGCSPDRATFLAVLKACGSLAALDAGRKIEAQIDRAKLRRDPRIATSLVDFYAKCGCMEDAQQVFDSMATKDLVAWDALIAGYSWQGDKNRVFDLFERMKTEARIQPDAVTFLSILTVCIHAGLVEKGEEFFHSMLPRYAVAPSIKHFTCMVDLLGRANRLEEAVTMILRMPFEPDSRIWMAVLRVCRDVELGKLAFDSILGLDEKNIAAYSLMANIYASAGMLEETARLKAIQSSTIAAPASPKQSEKSWWTDQAGVVHTFVDGDDQSEELHRFIADILARADGRRHTTAAWRSKSNEEAVLCGHSGNLAVARALATAPPNAVIRVVCDFWICEECHRVTASLSRMKQRKIVCRDSSRFHIFTDGRCSCE